MEFPHDSPISDAWKRIETWLAKHCPAMMLPAGVAENEFQLVENSIGLKMPEPLAELYRLHNGSKRIWLCNRGYLMPLFAPSMGKDQVLYDSVMDSWSFQKEMLEKQSFPDAESDPIGPIKTDWWNTRWIPITCNEGGDCLCVDMDPAPGGTTGQVIDWWHERGASEVIADGVADWLLGIAGDLEDGSFDPQERD